MPFVRIAFGGLAPAPATTAALQRQTTELLAGMLGKRPEVTVVAVESAPTGSWSAGGQPAGPLAYMEAFITAGSNSAGEKAAFIAAADRLLRATLGDGASPVYVAVHELPAGDWGYDGVSQAARRATAMPPATENRSLRSWAGSGPLPPLRPAQTALLLIDYQREYLDGRLPLPGAGAAAARARELVAGAERVGLRIIHIHHVAASASAPLFAPGGEGVQAIPGLAPAGHHLCLAKGMPSAFHATGLDQILRDARIDTLLLAGFMTHMCVDSTARDAVHRGYRVAVVGEACATRALPGGPDADVQQRASLAALADRFADIVGVSALTAALSS